ncbi:hypothetical protein, partial [Chelativorans intermedius]
NVICASSVLLVASNIKRTSSPFEWPSFLGAGHRDQTPRFAARSFQASQNSIETSGWFRA